MRRNLNEKATLCGLVSMARREENHLYLDVIYSAVSYIADLVYEIEQRERVCAETFKHE